MSSYGIFEAAVSSEAEVGMQRQAAVDSMNAAIYDVREKLGPSLFPAASLSEFRDRVAMMKHDQSIYKVIGEHLTPVTGVVRRIVGRGGVLEREFKDRLAQGRHESDAPWMDSEGKATGELLHGPNSAVAPKMQKGPGYPGQSRHEKAEARTAAGELKPKGNFKGYLKDVGKGARDKVKHNFTKAGPTQEHTDDPATKNFVAYRSWCARNGLSAARLSSLDYYAAYLPDQEYLRLAAQVQACEMTEHHPKTPDGQGKDKLKNVTASEYNPEIGGYDFETPGLGRHEKLPEHYYPKPRSHELGRSPDWDKSQREMNRNMRQEHEAISDAEMGRDNPAYGHHGSKHEHPGQRFYDEVNHDVPWQDDWQKAPSHALPELAKSSFGDEPPMMRRKVGPPSGPPKHEAGAHDINKSVGTDEYRNQRNPYTGQIPQEYDERVQQRDINRGSPVTEGFWPEPERPGRHRASRDPMRAYTVWCAQNNLKKISARNLEYYAGHNPQLCYHLGMRMRRAIVAARRRQAISDTDPTGTGSGGGGQPGLGNMAGDLLNPVPLGNSVAGVAGGKMGPSVSQGMDWGQLAHGADTGPHSPAPGTTTDLSAGPFAQPTPKPPHATARRRTAAPDYLQKADDALTQLLNQKAEEFQQTIAPLQQALTTVQQAEQIQQQQNPLNVLPPAGTVNVMPGGGGAGGAPGGAPGGASGGAGGGAAGGPDLASQLGMPGPDAQDTSGAANALANPIGAPPPGGGTPGGPPPAAAGGLPPDVEQQMLTARRRRAGGQGKGRGATRPHQAASVYDLWDKFLGDPQYTPRGGEPDFEEFQRRFQVGPRALNKVKTRANPYNHGTAGVTVGSRAYYAAGGQPVPPSVVGESPYPIQQTNLVPSSGGSGPGGRGTGDLKHSPPGAFLPGTPSQSGPQGDGSEPFHNPAEDMGFRQGFYQHGAGGDVWGPDPMGSARVPGVSPTNSPGPGLSRERGGLTGTGGGFGGVGGAGPLLSPQQQETPGGSNLVPVKPAPVPGIAPWGSPPPVVHESRHDYQEGNPDQIFAPARGHGWEHASGPSGPPYVRSELLEPADSHQRPRGRHELARRKQACYPGCHENAAHVRKYHKKKKGQRKTAWSGWGPAQFPKTRQVTGWKWDDHLNGYTANHPHRFACECGDEFSTPTGFRMCGGCGRQWNSYVIGTGGSNKEAAAERFLVREIPGRKEGDVIVASRHSSQHDDKRASAWRYADGSGAGDYVNNMSENQLGMPHPPPPGVVDPTNGVMGTPLVAGGGAIGPDMRHPDIASGINDAVSPQKAGRRRKHRLVDPHTGAIHNLIDPGEVGHGEDPGHSTFKSVPKDWARRGDGGRWVMGPTTRQSP